MANIARYNPFDELFNEFSKGFFVRPLAMPEGAEPKMKLDVKEDEKAYTVRADIPGVKKEDIHVDVDANAITVRAEVKQEKEEKKDEKGDLQRAQLRHGEPQLLAAGGGGRQRRQGRVQGRRAQPDAAQEGGRPGAAALGLLTACSAAISCR
jgi:hypothetical protein